MFYCIVLSFVSLYHTISNDACVKSLVERVNPLYTVRVRIPPCSRILKKKKNKFFMNCLYICIFVYLYICIFVYLYICIFVFSYFCIFVFLYLCWPLFSRARPLHPSSRDTSQYKPPCTLTCQPASWVIHKYWPALSRFNCKRRFVKVNFTNHHHHNQHRHHCCHHHHDLHHDHLALEVCVLSRNHCLVHHCVLDLWGTTSVNCKARKKDINDNMFWTVFFFSAQLLSCLFYSQIVVCIKCGTVDNSQKWKTKRQPWNMWSVTFKYSPCIAKG